LLLPAFDHARSYRETVALIVPLVARDECVVGSGLTPVQVAALEYHGHWRVDATAGAADGGCAVWLLIGKLQRIPPPPPGWRESARRQRMTESGVETILAYRRSR
jgi:hypothetical protein